MDYLRQVKLNRPLLAGTVLVGLGSIVTGGLAGSAGGVSGSRVSRIF
ncbi:hypothetical protein J0895_14875 [Phormidium pseudopriestleyi FRX01]|uniref:Uncharacterized protein n=1 Tax=Phormidium pseudopriestleyi FRX01 TaxID=1759528 RepID=A0ABS3FTB1_9CYAN|nr:hypothetical protein [Phormidium pseudopriestleyi]MBO0350362.1 hypothetical protein [Phormidium pseudopriestleyi FRX01]